MWLVGLLSGTFAGALIGKVIGSAWVGPVAFLGGLFGLVIGLIAGAGRRSVAPEGAEQRSQMLEKQVAVSYTHLLCGLAAGAYGLSLRTPWG